MEREDYVVWITTRTIKPGTYEDFRRAWRPKSFPDGMLRAYECDAGDDNEVIGIAIWDSLESCESYRLSDVEAERREAMAPFVESESSGVYTGRELQIPRD
jgi:heme-degrading monooxygenase HmoA